MSAERPDDSPVSRLVDVLDVKRNAKLGVVASLFLTLFAYGFFIVLPNQRGGGGGLGTYKPTAKPLYLVLAFVILVSTAMLVAAALTVRRVVRMTMSPPKWIRRGGTAAVAGGIALTAMALSGPVVAEFGLGSVFGQLLPFVPFVIVYGVWAVHAAHRHRYGYHGTAGAVLSAVGLVLVGWVALVDPGGLLGGELARIDPSLFLWAHLLALGGTSLLGSAVLRAGAVPVRAALAMLFVLPVGLGGLTVISYAGGAGFVSVALAAPLGVAWLSVGYELRRGRGIPPEDYFDAGVDLDGAD